MKNKTNKAQGEVVLTRFSKNSSEIHIKAQVAVKGDSAIIGKIRFFDESYTEGSILCVRKNEQIDREALLLCPPIAVIAFCDDSVTTLSVLCSLGIPCIVLNGDDICYEICQNKISLIDTEKGILMLDPSIDTIEFYLSAKSKSKAFSLNCEIGKIIKSLSLDKRDRRAEYYLTSSTLLSNKDFFNSAVGLWELFCPELLIFDIPISTYVEGDERLFSELAEELYRAALYGSLAISLSGFDTEEELTNAMRILHKTVCILEADGREFNSYLPRGITLSAPIWLMRPSPITNPDFLIFDLDSLLPALFSLPTEEIIKKEKALKKELISVFERYITTFAPKCDVYFKTKYFSSTALLQKLVRFTNAKAVFLE